MTHVPVRERGEKRKKQGPAASRDGQAPSGFTQVLDKLFRAAPGARGVALVDGLGETVDYVGNLNPFDLKVAAAEGRLMLDLVSSALSIWGQVRQITVRATKSSLITRRLRGEYALVFVLKRSGVAVSDRAINEAERDLSNEAGWGVPGTAVATWYGVDVESAPHDRRRPEQIRTGGHWQRLEVLGAVRGLRPGERGYRVRLRGGGEMTLVREPLGRWYSDELPQDDENRHPNFPQGRRRV